MGLLPDRLEDYPKYEPPAEPPATVTNAQFNEWMERANSVLQEAQSTAQLVAYRAKLCEALRDGLENDLAPELQQEKRPSTKRRYTADCKKFRDYCSGVNMPWRPAAPEMTALFLLTEWKQGQGVTPATVQRYVQSISFAHRLAGLYDPTQSGYVRAALRHIAKNHLTETTEGQTKQ
jgi:hypothetical protein